MAKTIGIRNGITLHGNVNRILEMAQGGMGDNAISGHFLDHGVKISPQTVRAIRTEAQELAKKPISKKSTQNAIKATQANKSGSITTGGLPA
ncbi:MAG: hypothetical protein ACXWFI_05800 [Methylobacter sp.]